MYQLLKQSTSALLIWALIPLGVISLHPFAADNASFNKTLIIVLLIYTIFFSVVTHELCHGPAAFAGGDTTARNSGRLTLNPVAHFSIVGTFLLTLILYMVKAPVMFGFA